jgi:AcrR family transcriptional regulator
MTLRAKSAGTGGCEKGTLKGAGQRIFDTACELFYKRGIRAVGVDEIVSAAGVTKPSLYRSFASKDELVSACLEKYAGDSRDDIDAALNAAGEDPRSRLRAFVGHYAAQMTQPGFRGCPMSNMAVEFPEPGHSGRDVVEHCKIEFRERLVALTRQMPVREPEALADGLVLLIEGAYSTHHVFGTQGPAQALVRSADALIESFSPRG